MNNLLVEGLQRQLSHLEEAQRNAPVNQQVQACAQCYHLFDTRLDSEGITVLDKYSHKGENHAPIIWPVEQVITKLRMYIETLAL